MLTCSRPGFGSQTLNQTRSLALRRHPGAAQHRIRCNAAPQGIQMDPAAKAAIQEWAAMGPLLAQCGIQQEEVIEHTNRWVELGDFLGDSLGFEGGWDHLDGSAKIRIYHFYLPVFFYVERQLSAHVEQREAAGLPPQPLVFGISAPQGCGKSTLVEQLVALLRHTGRAAVDVSIDDFYLPFHEQRALATANPDNPLLQVRGNAGTHDLPLGRTTLQALLSASDADTEVPIPRYDKAAQGGKGDRAPEDAWPRARGAQDVVLFEGWMLGFRALDAAAAADAADSISPHLATVNAALAAYADEWDAFVDAWLVLKVADPAFVYKWRMEAETKLRAKGRGGMSDAEVVDFVDRYMPAYKAYLPGLYAQGPSTAQPGRVVTIELNDTRTPVADQKPADE